MRMRASLFLIAFIMIFSFSAAAAPEGGSISRGSPKEGTRTGVMMSARSRVHREGKRTEGTYDPLSPRACLRDPARARPRTPKDPRFRVFARGRRRDSGGDRGERRRRGEPCRIRHRHFRGSDAFRHRLRRRKRLERGPRRLVSFGSARGRFFHAAFVAKNRRARRRHSQ